MAINEKVFIYCERGQDPGFWAEPVNAVTNAAFLVAGIAMLLVIAGRPAAERSLYGWTLALTALLIGVGSFLFHTVAERWAGGLDVGPILIFMLVAVYALARRLLDAPLWLAWGALAAFIALFPLMRLIPCEGPSCGGLGYAPALIALAVGGLLLLRRGDAGRGDGPVGRGLLGAAGVFALSLTFRSLDQPLCPWARVGDMAVGLHFGWHLFNAVVLYLVIRAISEGEARRMRAEGV